MQDGRNMARGVRIREQLLAAFKGREMTWGELANRVDLDLDETSVARKLKGKQVLYDFEIEAFARVLGLKITIEARA